MALDVTHTTAAGGVDSGDGKISKNAWNESHTLTMDSGKLLGRTTSGSGEVEQITYESGTYTPVLTAVTNVTSATPNAARYVRIGNIVWVSMSISITATTDLVDSALLISLPVASSMGSNYGLTGTGAENTSFVDKYVGCVFAQYTTFDKARYRFTSTTVSARDHFITFMYVVV